MYFFDANSIINLIKKGKVRPFAYGVTLELSLYESLNGIWKEYMLLKKLDENSALMFLEIIGRLFSVIETTSIKGLEKEVFNLASKENITVYDASYLYVALKNKFVLVTDDQKLMKKASKYVKVISSSELAAKY